MSRFTVYFSDTEELVIHDIIAFTQSQMDGIKQIASRYTKVQLRTIEKYGKDTKPLTESQKQTVLDNKNDILSGKTSKDLLEEEIVQVTLHSNKRSLERVGSNDETIFISLVDRLKKTNFVKKAQFKGYPELTYTTLEKGATDTIKLPISFKRMHNGNHTIKMITVAPKDTEPVAMEASVAEMHPAMVEMFLKLKEHLKKIEYIGNKV